MLARTLEVAVTLKLIAKRDLTCVIVDSNVQEKAIAHHQQQAAGDGAGQGGRSGPGWQHRSQATHAKEGRKLRFKAGRYAHARQFRRMRKVIKLQRTIIGRLQGEVVRKVTVLNQAVQDSLGQTLGKAMRLIAQTASCKALGNRANLYSWHAPEVGPFVGLVPGSGFGGLLAAIDRTHRPQTAARLWARLGSGLK